MLNKILSGVGDRVGIGIGTQLTITIFGASKEVKRDVCAFLQVHGFVLSGTKNAGAHIHPHDESKPDYIDVTFFPCMKQYRKKSKRRGGEKN